MKICSKCKLPKPHFKKHPKSDDGLNPWCFDCIIEYNAKWRLEHPTYNKDWKSKNPEYLKNWYKNHNSLHQILAHRLRARLRGAIKGHCKVGSAVEDLGCDISYFEIYLESLFQAGMTWQNYGVLGWHIDHIIPLSKFDLSKREEFKRACHYTNLQPLWSIDNIRKGNKLEF